MANQRPLSLSLDDQLSNMLHSRAFITETNSESHESSTSYPSSPLQPSNVTGTTTTTTTTTTSAPISGVSLPVDNPYDADDSLTSVSHEEYQVRTLGTHNITRLSILPVYPLVFLPTSSSSSSSSSLSSATSSTTPKLLLSNVPIESLSEEQYARVKYHAFPQLFKLQMDIGTKIDPEKLQIRSSESFLLDFYQNLYIKTKKRLKVDIPIIDFNLTRLHNCISKLNLQRAQQQMMLNTNELALALEFYLQFDVDMFFLKTCSFNDVKPRLFDNRFREGLFCIDTPEARFAITSCDNPRCLCCHSPCPRRHLTDQSEQTSVIPFSIPHIHRFVNQYEAILNCPATCETTNCIYVLTCPCGQFDFVGESKLPFAKTLALHREESNRIIREFLIGELNIEHITFGLKSDEKKAHDKMWLYQHSPRCSVALQLFLDYNPDYWCFVPMKRIEVNIVNANLQRSSPCRTNETTLSVASPSFHRRTKEITTTTSSVSSPSLRRRAIETSVRTRADEEVRSLLENIPKPPLGFDFSIDQHQQQTHFFKHIKDRIVPPDNVDVYNADIVAILPNNSSELFRQLIESLFITHAECKLNETGHLVSEYSDPNRSLHGSWCANLTCRPLAQPF